MGEGRLLLLLLLLLLSFFMLFWLFWLLLLLLLAASAAAAAAAAAVAVAGAAVAVAVVAAAAAHMAISKNITLRTYRRTCCSSRRFASYPSAQEVFRAGAQADAGRKAFQGGGDTVRQERQ